MNSVSRRKVLGLSLTTGLAAAAWANLPAADQPESGDQPHQTKRDWWNKEFQMLVTLGESTTAGGWASYRERSWAHQLAKQINEFQRVPVQLVNVGIGANVISTRSTAYEHSGKPAATERIEPHVIRHKPDLLVISYGLNDARGGTPVDLFAEELRTLIDRIREKVQPLIVLPGPYFMTAFDKYKPFDRATLETFQEFNRQTAAVAGEKECLFVDLLAAYANAPWMVHHDGVHANDLGHRIVANQIFGVLAANCSGLARETQELEQFIPRWRDESVLQQERGK